MGFMWNCPWRIEWKRRFEYWSRSQFGPFYFLHSHPKSYWEEYEREMDEYVASVGETE